MHRPFRQERQAITDAASAVRDLAARTDQHFLTLGKLLLVGIALLLFVALKVT